MKLKEINRIESNGSTALHVAAWYGYFEIVELLLKHGCSTTTVNKYGKTAAQECHDERIRQLLLSSSEILSNDEQTNDHTPKLKWCQIYENIDNQDKSVVATKIMKLRLRTYLTQKFKTNEATRTDHLRKIIHQSIGSLRPGYEGALDILQQFQKTKNPEYLITLYTIQILSYRHIVMEQDEVFFTDLLIGLTVFQERFFTGYAYRGDKLDTAELDFYLWIWHHRTSFIEIHTITNTSASRQVAEMSADIDSSIPDKIKTLFIFHFTERCEMAIDLRALSSNVPDLSLYSAEGEILIIPGSFFEVISIKKPLSTDNPSDFTIIEMKNIPVSRDILLKTINELQ